jgi:sigma-E factor negative regulatory protein RseA
MNEKLSALMDGELTELETRRVLQELEGDTALRATWERYHLVRATLRDELELAAAPGLADRLADRFDAHPAVARAGREGISRTLWAGGLLAAATSIAAVALFGVQLFQPPTAPTPIAATPSAAPAATTVARTVSTGRWKTGEPEVERTLDTYLVEHNEFASSAGVGGMLPYVRVVGYGPEK